MVPAMRGSVVIVGGTSGICLRLAERYAAHGSDVVITGRDAERAAAAAAGIPGPGTVQSRALDLAEPSQIAGALENVGTVDRLVLGAIERDENTVAAYDLERAL